MRHNALETIKQHAMLPAGSRIVVGFSGGADSVALLSFLWELRQQMDWTVEACHINHQLRGGEALRDEAFCRDFCQHRGIALHVFREDVALAAKLSGKSVEECGREIRYERFYQLMNSESDRIATAHHANDLTETVLFHITRGTGLKGLMGIPPVRGQIVRPLLYCSRKEIEAYCEEQGLTYVVDSSNESDEYSRNLLRHQVIPQLEKLNPALIRSAVRLAKQVQSEEDYLQQQTEKTLQELTLSECRWNREKFLQLHPAMKQRVIAYWLEQAGAELSAKKINDCLSIIENLGVLELRKGIYLVTEQDEIRIKEAEEFQEFFSVPFQVGELSLFPGKSVTVQPIDRAKYKLFENNRAEVLKNALDCDKIFGDAVMRQKLPGDAIALPGFSKARSLKKLLNQHKIPVVERSRMVVLCDEKGLLWLEGFGVRADARPDENSCHIVLIHPVCK